VNTSQTTGDIKSIIIDAPVRIILHNNKSDKIFITGTKRLINDLELKTNNETLTIKHNKKNYIQKSKLIELNISAKYLQHITANMAFEMIAPEVIKTDDLLMIINGGAKFAEIELNVDCKRLTLNIYGNNNIGNYLIGGQAESSHFSMEGSVNINALDFECENVHVTHKSIGKCKVQSSSLLTVKTYSSGDTYYKGNPKIVHEYINVPYLQATGKLIKID
jgi:hypothetical protein